VEVTAKCPGCDRSLPIEVSEAPPAIACGACGRRIDLAVSDAVRRGEAVDVCPVCEGADFYGRKDFNPSLGLGVVAAGALISAGFYWFAMDLVAYGVLGAAALLDLVIYGRLREVTICYRCHSEFRGDYRKTAPPFDLHLADRFEPEYEKKIGRR